MAKAEARNILAGIGAALEDLTNSMDKAKQSRNTLVRRWGRLQSDVDRLQAENERLKETINIIKHDIKAEAVTTQWIEKFITEQALKEK